MESERIALALEALAAAMGSIANTLEKRFQREYPVRGAVREILVTHRKTDEEILRESQGYSEETDEAWQDLGPREKSYRKAEERRAARAREKQGGATKTRSTGVRSKKRS